VAPEFEAATVKPVPAGTEYGGMRGGPGTSSPGQIHYDATTLRAVIARAYGVQRFQIAAPKWIDDERYDIVAKIPPGTAMPQFQLMLQKFLADRFQLKLHKEERISSTLELTIAKSGSKLTAVPLPSAVPISGDAPKPAPSGLQWINEGEKVLVRGHAFTIRQLLVWITEATERQIVDKTGLTGAYDFEMPLAQPVDMDEQAFAGMLDATFEKYLGLKVVARKEPIETLVIDRLERVPVEN
jgi:uncharacterized protein (TIGR03435 family)